MGRLMARVVLSLTQKTNIVFTGEDDRKPDEIKALFVQEMRALLLPYGEDIKSTWTKLVKKDARGTSGTPDKAKEAGISETPHDYGVSKDPAMIAKSKGLHGGFLLHGGWVSGCLPAAIHRQHWCNVGRDRHFDK